MHFIRANKLNSILILGLLAIAGILVLQLVLIKQAYTNEGKKFSEKAHIALLQVVEQLYRYQKHEFPLKNPVNKVSNDYFVVNVNNDFDSEVLEFYLRSEFEKAQLLNDFEYAIYNCQSNDMVYGNYVSFTNKNRHSGTFHFPKQPNLVYYFAVRFPNQHNYLLGSMKLWLWLSLALLVILIIYVYSFFTILQQKKYSALQRDFINNMTHEFKTPLSSILIAADYLAKQPAVKEDARMLTYTEIVRQQAQKLNQHVSKVLDIAKYDNSAPELKKENLIAEKIILQAAETLTLQYPHLNVRIDSNGNTPLTADSFHFSNLVHNLIDNAVKYGTEQVQVTVTIRNDKQFTEIVFSDNGPGIPAPYLRQIFDKFYRVPVKKTAEVNGFGLGLYYVKKVCHLHGWQIEAHNTAPHGLSVCITIPDNQ